MCRTFHFFLAADLPLRASYRVAKLGDGACAYGSQSTLDRIGGADLPGSGSRRGSVSLMSEIGAQYHRLVEKYESLLLRRTESSLGQVSVAHFSAVRVRSDPPAAITKITNIFRGF